ncbi:hypothetical protein CWB99_08510 [Pseudoalteromonas rubra]|uniref:Lipoprotein n=1 Tax=Pseudoalteromonas rubra TaxID=43658 RepID=A0A5S3WPU6_9GAMM|nr:hypothetical protein [Pseudoalteromonas rubra]TMP29633.1 hypothetical protein CWB99_08510 [Pseudoalteromonas rubra]TMP35226.1 hypothetical protein CWC00_05475 [Pseudoalteromonas rubra]
MRKIAFILLFSLAGCDSKNSSEVAPESFEFKSATLSVAQLNPNYSDSANNSGLSFNGEFYLYGKEQGKIKLSAQDRLVFTSPNEQQYSAQNIPKTSSFAEQCCKLEISGLRDTQYQYQENHTWLAELTRNSKVMESFELALPQMAQFIYPGASVDYQQFAFTGNDVILTWHPETAKDLIRVRYTIGTQHEGQALCSGQDAITEERADNLSELNGELVIPADKIALCPQPVAIDITLDYDNEEQRTITTQIQKNTFHFIDFEMVQMISLYEDGPYKPE